ncbi:hypothetical protein N7532_004836 [Penicillium argentinense]|uniref:Uncharacterized protein n=1 Tax=Penicillium argentinense TaxID=1131581 RepID=A0A9W9FCR3_9EURO|nr:uncharacterized protein N7532_004836 [Penicillium argentinense]KAJ5097835.1 hypothetical protein N7532_004836 [Penicillium argentinense]
MTQKTRRANTRLPRKPLTNSTNTPIPTVATEEAQQEPLETDQHLVREVPEEVHEEPRPTAGDGRKEPPADALVEAHEDAQLPPAHDDGANEAVSSPYSFRGKRKYWGPDGESLLPTERHKSISKKKKDHIGKDPQRSRKARRTSQGSYKARQK